MVIYEQDIDAWFDVAVLICVVEQDHIGVVGGLVGGQSVYSFAAVFIYCDIDIGKLALHLVGFVAYHSHGRVVIGQKVAPTFALIASAEYCYFGLVLQQSDEIFHMWGLARASHGDVAHRNHGHTEAPTAQQTQLKELVARPYCQPIEPTQGAQCVVYFDKIAFQIL